MSTEVAYPLPVICSLLTFNHDDTNVVTGALLLSVCTDNVFLTFYFNLLS